MFLTKELGQYTNWCIILKRIEIEIKKELVGL